MPGAQTRRAGRQTVLLRFILLALWNAWWTVVFATNISDAAKALGLFGAGSVFASGNFRLLTRPPPDTVPHIG